MPTNLLKTPVFKVRMEHNMLNFFRLLKAFFTGSQQAL